MGQQAASIALHSTCRKCRKGLKPVNAVGLLDCVGLDRMVNTRIWTNVEVSHGCVTTRPNFLKHFGNVV